VDCDLRELFQKHYFIGFYSDFFCLVQFDSSAYLLEIRPILQQFFYQLCVFSFGNMGSFKILNEEHSGIRVVDLLKLFYKISPDDDNEMENNILKICANIKENATILWNYFSIEIIFPDNKQTETENQKDDNTADLLEHMILRSLPSLIEGYIPDITFIPILVYQLGNVTYEESLWLEEVCTIISKFFAFCFLSEENSASENEPAYEVRLNKSSIKNLVFPLLKNKFLPPKNLKKFIQKVTDTQEAFRKFGRC